MTANPSWPSFDWSDKTGIVALRARCLAGLQIVVPHQAGYGLRGAIE